ncbi:MAG: hypothetical protein KatS3mg079_446 [Caloramator sp.]|nr:MAG: hypothetical protein KatS3mg079_446 [Caloramator sp.]
MRIHQDLRLPTTIYHLAEKAKEIIDLGNQTGEGWLLTAEMIELIEMGVPNIACLQPFACLPNHVTGKGVAKALRERYKDVNIVAIDYDPGASEVNQVNRLKLMMSVAHRRVLESAQKIYGQQHTTRGKRSRGKLNGQKNNSL